MPNEMMNAAEKTELKQLETIVRNGLGTFVDVGNALIKIRTAKLYRESHGTFEAYCGATFEMSIRRAQQMMVAAEVIADLEPNVNLGEGSKAKKVSPLPSNESQANALAKVDPSDREGVWAAAIKAAPKDKNGEPKITAKIIEAAAVKLESVDEIPIDAKPAKHAAPSKSPVDRVGQPIPHDRIITAFNRSREIKDLMRSVSDVRTVVERGMEEANKDPIFYPLNFNQFRAHCLNAYRELKQCQPHAVCPYCGGDGCRVCAQQGWVNELTYTNYVPQDLKV